jgi:hypothetical protein
MNRSISMQLRTDAARPRRLARSALVGSLFAVGAVVAFEGVNAGAYDAGAGAAPARAPTDRGVWNAVFRAGQRWILSNGGGDSGRMIVETTDLRRVDGADVVRLRWLHQADATAKPKLDPNVDMPTQLARTPRGVYFLRAEQDDRAVALAIKGRPTHTDPPRLVDSMSTKGASAPNVTRRRSAKGDVYCFGRGPGKDAGECEDVCFGEFCVSTEAGVVEVGGTYAPGYDRFRAPGAE